MPWGRDGQQPGEGCLIRRPRTDPRVPEPFSQLTPRELEVVRLLASGLSNEEISRRLVISEHTVKNHISSIYRKLRTDDRVRVALMAVRAGLVLPEGGP
ncbi:MAG TPA: response regulator transcription factor [Limnochordales bacterium]